MKVHVPGIALLQVKEILRELLPISFHLRSLDGAAQEERDWLTLSYKVDKLLFWLYVLVLVAFAVTLCSLWIAWGAK